MPCDVKIHKVQEKWEKRVQREKEEADRRQKEAIPAPNWPTKKPAEVPSGK